MEREEKKQRIAHHLTMIALLAEMEIDSSRDQLVFIKDGEHFVIDRYGLAPVIRINLQQRVKELEGQLFRSSASLVSAQRRLKGMVESRILGKKETQKLMAILESGESDREKIIEMKRYLQANT